MSGISLGTMVADIMTTAVDIINVFIPMITPFAAVGLGLLVIAGIVGLVKGR